MKRTVFVSLVVAAVTATMLPGSANPPAQRNTYEMINRHADRYVPGPAGTTEKLSLLFGPYTIPPGQDSNRITLDLPPLQGFITAVAPDLVDATNGRIPTEQEAHIHHAHWFRVDPFGNHESYTSGLSWVFGTGEEKTQGLFEHRWNMDPSGPMYGMPVEAANPQVLIYMIHNKTSSPLTAYVVLDVRFIHGDEASIETALGRDIHPIEGTLFGQTADAHPARPELAARYVASADGTIVAMGSHLHPGGKYTVVANLGPAVPQEVEEGEDPLPPLAMCAADSDGDGFPGVTLLNSRKFDRIPGAQVYSEDYQMGATKFGWRAPIHKGDVIAQFAPYSIFSGAMPEEVPDNLALDVEDSRPDYLQYSQEQWDLIRAADPGRFTSADGLDHAWYEGMTYTGLYVDRQAPVALIDTGNVCNPANYKPWLHGADTFFKQSRAGIVENTRGYVALTQQEIDAIKMRYAKGVTEGMINHAWVGDPDPLCGLERTALDVYEWKPSWELGCTEGAPAWSTAPGIATDVISVAGFTYLPGDLGLGGEMGAPPKVAGDSLTLVNQDAAINVRHTFTSCIAPCNGDYVSNYPLPDGYFDTDKMGNVDPIDGGFTGDWTPEYELDVSDFDPGIYTYFCRIHPWMRGAFEKV